MRMPINLVRQAEKLLDQEDITPDMVEYLEEIEGLICRMGGQLASRQVAAVAIASWRQMERNKK